MSQSAQVTLLLQRWQAGDQKALDDMLPFVYQELRRLAMAQLNRNQNNSIQCTELISEAYLRLVNVENIQWQGRTHFYSIAARTMRRVLVEQFRKSHAEKRGGNQTVLSFHEERHSAEPPETVELDSLEHALQGLEKLDARQAEIVTLKFFGGLTTMEIAEVLSISERTVRRDWSVARLWLFKTMKDR